MHAKRVWKHGDSSYSHTDVARRLKEYSKYNPETGCIEWQRTILESGYGQLSVEGKGKRVHRLAWEQEKGPIPEGLYVLHRCNNPKCLNIDHLWLGTAKDNADHRYMSGNTTGGRRKADIDLKMLRAIRRSNKPYAEIARKYGYTPGHISRIKRGKVWAHIK